MHEELNEMRERLSQLEAEVGTLKQQLKHIEMAEADQLFIGNQPDEQHKPIHSNQEGKEPFEVKGKSKEQLVSHRVDENSREQTSEPLSQQYSEKRKISNSISKQQSSRTSDTVRQKQASSSNTKLKDKVDFESLLGIWLPRVFMFILLLGVLWGLKVGMDNGWITNSIRVVIGYTGTILLLFAGMHYVKQQKKLFGHTLLGGFIALGILTTFAAHHLYDYFNALVAFCIGILYIIGGMILAKRMKSETLTIFSAIAGFLLPFLLEGAEASTLLFCTYILVLFLSFFYVSLSEKHKLSFYITFLLFHLTLFAYGLLEGTTGKEPIIVGTVVIQHLLLLVYYVKGTVSRVVFNEVLIYTNVVFMIAWIKLLERQQETVLYGLLALLYAMLAIYFIRKKSTTLKSVVTAVAVFTISVWLLSIQWDVAQLRLIFLLINGTIGLWVGFNYKAVRTIVMSAFVYGLTAYVVISFITIQRFFSIEHFSWMALLITMCSVYYIVYQMNRTKIETKQTFFAHSLIIGQFIVFLYIHHLANTFIHMVNISYPTALHVKMLIYLLVLILMYFMHKWKHGLFVTHASIAGFGIVGLVLIVIPMRDFYDNNGFYFHLFVQLIYVLLFTVCFIAIKRKVFYKNTEWLNRSYSKLAVGVQLLYFIFINKWYLASTAVWHWDEEFVLLGHTFLLFLFAFASVSFGGKMHWKYVRIGGFILLVLCVFKLFIVDLASVSIVVRAILFIGVGVVGLFYSRTLLKDDKNA
ncbi:DUF2339 domain-containing protein [Virgibacillus sp. W0430]|uniref:DUF2339 domain-containing protein n=1 Tax=Virgibacillus sp. W0430 TaxID=3391580 RepID=UPI003F48EE46